MTLDITLQPLLPLPWLVGLLFPALGLACFALVRRARGAGLRLMALAVLCVALLDPRLTEERRKPLPDVAVVVVDDSPSQSIGARPQQTEKALAQLQASLAAVPNLNVRVVRSDGNGAGNHAGETRLFDAMDQAVGDGAQGRLAALFLITDGQVHDVPGAVSQVPWLTAPLHVLLTGAPGEHDRRIAIDHAPAYGLVGSSVEVAFRVDELAPAKAVGSSTADVSVSVDGKAVKQLTVPVGETATVSVPISHAGSTLLELQVAAAPGEVSTVNNHAVVAINGIRERLRVLLVSGQPHPGERMWRNLLKSDPSVDLVHFTILRPPEKDDATPLRELSLIVFPVQELFEEKLKDFDLVIFDRYIVRGILPTAYYGYIADYVRNGGALLLAVGPEFADGGSVARTALANILPAEPNGQVMERGFRPELTDAGRRHPITAGLAGAPIVAGDGDHGSDGKVWGRWFRVVDAAPHTGNTLLTDDEGHPLLVIDRVGKGRVAQLLSDQIWLWARGYEGGGPQQELLRRLAHWLMKEPDLEEDLLQAHIASGRLYVEQRSASSTSGAGGDHPEVTVTDPLGRESTLALTPGQDGLARGDMAAATAGLWRVKSGDRLAFAASGRLDPPELADLRATADLLSPIVTATGGGLVWLSQGFPELRRVSPQQDAAGREWLGLRRNDASAVTGMTQIPLLPGLLTVAVILSLLAGAWWREGR